MDQGIVEQVRCRGRCPCAASRAAATLMGKVRLREECRVMAEQPSGVPVPARLHELAQLLRQAQHLGPAAQAELARLVDELSQSLDPARLPEASRQHLEESTA